VNRTTIRAAPDVVIRFSLDSGKIEVEHSVCAERLPELLVDLSEMLAELGDELWHQARLAGMAPPG
jgi:hypothetical protein